MKHISMKRRMTALFISAAFLACAIWRGLLAVRHYATSLTIDNDPSIRELEQVNALFESGLATLLLVHALALWVISKHWFQFRGMFALGVAILCGGIVSGALMQLPIFSMPGVYPASIILGVGILSWLMLFDWASLYCGALLGSFTACFLTTPTMNTFACLFVVIPSVLYVFVGAAFSRRISRLRGRKRAG